MSWRVTAVLPFVLGATLSLHAAALPLRDGERLTFRVSWAIVPGAGEIKISASQNAAASQLIVTTTTATRRLAKMLLPFEAEAKSVFDLQTGRLVSLHETSLTKGKRDQLLPRLSREPW